MVFTFTSRTAAALLLSTTSLLLLSLGLLGWAYKPWNGEFSYATQPICAETSYDPAEKRRTRALDPAFDYIPYYDLHANRDCSDYSLPLRKRPLSDFVQCGFTHYGPYKKNTLNWAFGPDHHKQYAPGSSKGANWKAMGKIGKSSLYAQDGMMFGRFTLAEQGALRDPHWHSNAAEFTYILKGTARVTVAGLPKTDLAYRNNNIVFDHEGQQSTQTIEDSNRESETFILRPGDAFYSPVGYHHYFEGVDANDPLVGVAVFDTSDLKTFDTPQMMKAMPNEMLSQVLGVPTEEVEDYYKGFRRLYTDPHDGWKEENLADALANDDNPDLRFKIPGIDKGLTQAPRMEFNGDVRSKAIDSFTWKPLSKARFSFAYTEITPGSTLEPYWTDNADELLYVIEGQNLEVIRSSNGKRECKDVFTINEGFLALNEIGSTMLIKNNSPDVTTKLFRIFNSNRPSVTTLHDAFHSLPEDVAMTMLRGKYYEKYEYAEDIMAETS
eukprot:CAMPEP_0183745936 /NCGR_PEP_ID=MMETSP0737-20130205/66493_1 /TAXON_ID=385413 /ORGANISM="Thalassiosira miniscula, Strain CCMP1093" /LENGTH=495 /DNA_ID=CAMNT_0025981615 /DNA_START=66 /DNA_END=1553 /DNA_ORIENTATION=+